MEATQKLVQILKESEQDFEWYPTTPEIIEEIKKTANLHYARSFLDIGAGRGDVLYSFTSEDSVEQLYAIEKSRVHIENYDPKVIVIGTEFHQQTLIDKEMDLIYCNPPYSEYEEWSSTIIREGNASRVLLLIPDRWKKSERIKHAIDVRDARVISLGFYDFENAERSARCHVELIQVTYGDRSDDPFSIWFDEVFREDLADGCKASEDSVKEPFSERLDNQMAKGRNLIETLAELYRDEMSRTVNLFSALCRVDPSLLAQVGVESGSIKEALKQKISGMKNKYWKELFDNLDKITSRLSRKSRYKMIDKLTSHSNLDFTEENAYSVVIWAVKNANYYYDEQLVDLFKRLSDDDCAKPYKSNRHWKDSTFRFARGDERSHYKLDYRIVHYCYAYSDFDLKMNKEYGSSLSMQERPHDVMGDICAIGNNLGFPSVTHSRDIQWEPGEEEIFYYSTGKHPYAVGEKTEYGVVTEVHPIAEEKRSYMQYRFDGDEQYYHEDSVPRRDEFFRARPYKKGTVHFKLNQKFMMKLNIEAARILGWVSNPKEAAEETGYPIEDIKQVFDTSFRIELSGLALLPQPEIEKKKPLNPF